MINRLCSLNKNCSFILIKNILGQWKSHNRLASPRASPQGYRIKNSIFQYFKKKKNFCKEKTVGNEKCLINCLKKVDSDSCQINFLIILVLLSKRAFLF